MKSLMTISMSAIVLITAFMMYYEISNYSRKYVSKCCSSSYQELITRDKYNKEENKIYCINCKKWCELKEIEPLIKW